MNFRQFKGVQSISFAPEKSSSGRNVTVIFGQNGRGKTGIFRAIMFCLYGEHKLSQDEDISAKELLLVNTAAVREASEKGNHAEAYAALIFKHGEDRYELKRSLIGIDKNGERIEQVESVVLFHTSQDGNTSIYKDPDDIRIRVNEILDENVKDYFLFDGEKIQRLTLASLEQRREIARGIRNLLKVNALEKAIKSSAILRRQIAQEISKKATGEYARIVASISKAEENKSVLTEAAVRLEENISLAKIEKKKIDKKMEECKEILHLVQERKEAENRLVALEEELKNYYGEIKGKTGKLSLLLLSSTVDKVFERIDHKKKKGEIPAEMRSDLIEKILQEMRCICGREIHRKTEEFAAIIAWKNKLTDSVLDDAALDVWRFLSSLRSNRDDTRDAAEALLQKCAVCQNEIEKSRAKIGSLNSLIGGSERKDAADLESVREKIEQDQVRSEAELLKIKDQMKHIQDELQVLIEQRKKLEKDENLKNELIQRASLIEDTHSALQAVFDSFTAEIKQKIAAEANYFFRELIASESGKALGKIIVNEDYSLQITDRWNNHFLANISAGQRQIMSISFIVALAKVASADKILEMPLFMDTPFGRLSFEHRKNILQKVPKLCAQWVLLVTDTEFRKTEAELLESGGCWGNFYMLSNDDHGVTQIKGMTISDARLILSDALGGE